MEPSESTKQAAHEIMLYAERCRPGRMNQFTVEEIIQRAMNPDPATNPTPETPTRSECFKALACLYLTTDQRVADDLNVKVRSYIFDLERALADAKRENERQCLQLIDERDEAEQALGQAYYLVTGTSPEWSNNFGHEQALEEIDGAQQLLRAEIERLKAERQWQPIETAPKDGTYILACAHGLVWQANWSIQYGWNRFNSCDVGWYPTHWMPLPAARTTQEG